MKISGILLAVAAGFTAGAQEEPIAVSAEPFVFAVDTCFQPRHVRTADELADYTSENGLWRTGWGVADTVALIAPDGKRRPLVSSADKAGAAAIPVTSGGIWTLESAAYGSFAFTVRQGVFGETDDGTAQKPARIVDADEIIDRAAAGTLADDWYFVPAGFDGLLSSISIPSGYYVEAVGSGIWHLVKNEEGCLFKGGEIAFVADSRGSGPDRRVASREMPEISYSGDGWLFGAQAASTLALTSPAGAVTTTALTGTGGLAVEMNESGWWTVVLTAQDGRTWTSRIFATYPSFILYIR
jgi:hypothetical protein